MLQFWPPITIGGVSCQRLLGGRMRDSWTKSKWPFGPRVRTDMPLNSIPMIIHECNFLLKPFLLPEIGSVVWGYLVHSSSPSSCFIRWIQTETTAIRAPHLEKYLNTSFQPERCRRGGGWNCKRGLPYILQFLMLENDAEGEHRLFCPGVDTETISWCLKRT